MVVTSSIGEVLQGGKKGREEGRFAGIHYWEWIWQEAEQRSASSGGEKGPEVTVGMAGEKRGVAGCQGQWLAAKV